MHACTHERTHTLTHHTLSPTHTSKVKRMRTHAHTHTHSTGMRTLIRTGTRTRAHIRNRSYAQAHSCAFATTHATLRMRMRMCMRTHHTRCTLSCSSPKPDCVPIPANKRQEWGPGHDLTRLGLTALTHTNGMIEVENGATEIRFKADKKVQVIIDSLKCRVYSRTI